MKTICEFPNFDKWKNSHVQTPNKRHFQNDFSSDITYKTWDVYKSYALFYLLALHDCINDGFITDTMHGCVTISYFTGMGWIIDSYSVGVIPLFYFESAHKASEFLSHKSSNTDTITQLNILYNINQ